MPASTQALSPAPALKGTRSHLNIETILPLKIFNC